VLAARRTLAREQGHLVIERARAGLRREAGTWGENAGAARLMRAVQRQLDPQRILTPERLVS
jgi:FAD/FMN-containing dehydrogenase